jgi:hypothetical protein
MQTLKGKEKLMNALFIGFARKTIVFTAITSFRNGKNAVPCQTLKTYHATIMIRKH